MNNSPLMSPRLDSANHGVPDSCDQLVWPNNMSNNNHSGNSSFGRGSYRNTYNDTPPPSANMLRSPLSILTTPSHSEELNVYTFTSPNYTGSSMSSHKPASHFSNQRYPYDQVFHTESMKHIKASNFLSPVVRDQQNARKLNEFASNLSSSSNNSSGQNSLNGSKFSLTKNNNR